MTRFQVTARGALWFLAIFNFHSMIAAAPAHPTIINPAKNAVS